MSDSERKQVSKRSNIAQEIKDHPKWCSKDCRTFLPEEYREARKRSSAKEVQDNYDSCHIWR